MPRTKQTQPRHIVEGGKGGEGRPRGPPEAMKDDNLMEPEESFPDDESDTSSSTSSAQWINLGKTDLPPASTDKESRRHLQNQECQTENAADQKLETCHKQRCDGEVQVQEKFMNNANRIGPFENNRKHSPDNTDCSAEYKYSLAEFNKDVLNVNSNKSKNNKLVSEDHQLALIKSPKKGSNQHNAANVSASEIFLNKTEHRKISTAQTEEKVVTNNHAHIGKASVHLPQHPMHSQRYVDSVTLQYFSTLKAIMERSSSTILEDDNNADFWKSWMNATFNSSQQNVGSLQTADLYNQYLTQMTERWNSLLLQQFSTATTNKMSFAGGSNRMTSRPTVYQDIQEQSFPLNSPKSNDSFQVTPEQLTPPLSDHMSTSRLSQIPPRESVEVQTLPNGVTVPPAPLPDETSKKNALALLPRESKVVARPSTSSGRPPTPLKIPKQTNSSMFDRNSPLSAPAFEKEAYGSLPYNPFVSYGSWLSSDMMTYPPNKLPDHFQYPRLSGEKSNQYAQSRSSVYSNPSSANMLIPRRRSFSSEKTAANSSQSLPRAPRSSFYSFSPTTPYNTSPRRKFSEPAMLIKSTHKGYLDDFRRGYNLMQGSYAPPWFNGRLPSMPATRFETFPPSLGANGKASVGCLPFIMSGSKLEKHLVTGEDPGFPSSSPYKSESNHAASQPVGKISGARRSRGSRPVAPVDSFHAAIVSRAKEQFKGLDPENMYIQCPICHKRIKRLYHFQRHMRIHTGEKSHQCPFCQYKSVRKDNLKSHMKTHEKQSAENGKKTSKSCSQTNRNSDLVNEKGHKTSPFVVCTNASVPSEKKIEESLNKTEKQMNTVYQRSGVADLSPHYLQEKCISNQTSFSSPRQLTQPTAFVFPPTQGEKLDDGLTSESQIEPRLQQSVAPVISPLLFHPSNASTTAIDLKQETKTRGQVGRVKKEFFADMKLTLTRPNSAKLPDVSDKTESLKRSHSGLPLVETFSHQKYEDMVLPKRLKLKSNDRTAMKKAFHYDSKSTKLNKNNNNDSGIAEKTAKATLVSSPSKIGGKICENEAIKRKEVQWPSPSPTQMIQENYASASPISPVNVARDLSHHFIQRRFETGASAALAELATTAAADAKSQLKDTIRSLPNIENDQTFSDKSKGLQHSPLIKPVAMSSFQPTPGNTQTLISPPPLETSSILPHHEMRDKFQPSSFVQTTTRESFSPSEKDIQKQAFQPNRNTFGHFQLNKLAKSLLHEEKGKNKVDDSSEAINPHAPPCFQEAAKSADGVSMQPKGFNCRLCSFTSCSNAELQSHVTVMHKKDGFYKCEECTYLGKNLSKLVEHIRIHTGERPFKCDQCSYAAKRKDNLAQHKAVRHDKRKTKSSGNVYSTADHAKQDGANRSATTSLPNSRFFDKSRETLDNCTVSPSASDKLSLFSSIRFLPQMNVFANFCDKSNEPTLSPSASAPSTPPYYSFPTIPGFSSSMFHCPLYPVPPIIPSSELNSRISESAGKSVNNPGTYSLKVRAALITP